MMELYYSIVNLIDFLALSEPDGETAGSIYGILDNLLNIYASVDGETPETAFSAIADANNAGGATSWRELVEIFREMYNNGERLQNT